MGIRKALGTVFIVILIAFFAGCVLMVSQFSNQINPQTSLKKKSILALELKGIIFEPDKFLSDLREYAGKDEIRGVIITVNSPGGVVGPSQELYTEIKRVREELKKPVVVACSGVAASGAYYAAVAADQIYTNPGSMLGSIGVIMEFANLEKLYDWAKIERYTITTGAYKDSGADYRSMRPDERALFQALADDVLSQFRKAVAEGRKMDPAVVAKYSDGRVFTGEMAVRLGFADKVGTYTDALRAVGQLAGLGENPEVFEPPVKRTDIFELLGDMKSNIGMGAAAKELLQSKLWGQPLFLMPGSFAFPDSN